MRVRILDLEWEIKTWKYMGPTVTGVGREIDLDIDQGGGLGRLQAAV